MSLCTLDSQNWTEILDEVFSLSLLILDNWQRGS
jgi:hypothetical protein